jgi:hypothetical protein
MKTHTHFMLAILAAVLLIFSMGFASGDIPVPAIPEKAVLSTITFAGVQGIATSSTSLSLQLGTRTLNDPPLENGGFPWEWWAGEDAPLNTGYSVAPYVIKIYKGKPVPPGEVQYTAGYDEVVTAVSGDIGYQKSMSISTLNKTAGEDNIAAERIISFIGGDGGRMTTTEDILIDGTGAQTVSTSRFVCPFAGSASPFLPPFCNIVTSGSSADISSGSISTSSGLRFITATADIPVAETYRINMKGITGPGGYSDAVGTVSASIKAHLQEGTEKEVPRWFTSDPVGYTPEKAEDLAYSEISMASGSISSFTKDLKYQSGIRLV